MKKLFFLTFFLPQLLFAQYDSTMSRSFSPQSIVWLDVVNFYHNYPAILLAYERQFDPNIALHQEIGPIISPEAYNVVAYSKYIGFKARTELRLYLKEFMPYKSREFIGMDVSYQLDQFVADYQADMGSFRKMESGLFVRQIVGSHIRIGTQEVFYNNRVIVSGSVGFGRSIYRFKKPADYAWS